MLTAAELFIQQLSLRLDALELLDSRLRGNEEFGRRHSVFPLS
jgi:hypothetical protein